MNPVSPLSPDRLYRPCDTDRFTFTTTDELENLTEGIGQMRAIDAAHFGIGMRHAGYNLYVMGQPGSGKRTLMRQLLDQRVGGRPNPPTGATSTTLPNPTNRAPSSCLPGWAHAFMPTCSNWCRNSRPRFRRCSRVTNTGAA